MIHSFRGFYFIFHIAGPQSNLDFKGEIKKKTKPDYMIHYMIGNFVVVISMLLLKL